MKILDIQDIKNFLRQAKKLAIVTMGNPIRGDDAVALFVGRELSNIFDVIIAESAPENYLFKILQEGYTDVIFIDSVRAPFAPGTILRLNKNDLVSYMPSTHDVPLHMILELLESKGINVMIIGIVPKYLDFSEKLSDEVIRSAKRLVEMFKRSLKKINEE